MCVSAEQVEKAQQMLAQYLRPTRLLRAESLERRYRARVLIKMESDLPTHSFKPRGALNALLTTAEQRPLAGVVAASTVDDVGSRTSVELIRGIGIVDRVVAAIALRVSLIRGVEGYIDRVIASTA